MSKDLSDEVYIYVAYTGHQSYDVHAGMKWLGNFKIEHLVKRGADIRHGWEGAFGLFSLTPAFQQALTGLHPEIVEKMSNRRLKKYKELALDYATGKKKPPPTKEEIEYKERAERLKKDRGQPMFPGNNEMFDNTLILS